MNQRFNLLQENHIISLKEDQNIVVNHTTFKIGELIQGIKNDRFYYGHYKLEKWLGEGLECEALIPGEQWTKGRFKLAFLFYPDEVISPLDDFRQNIDRENP